MQILFLNVSIKIKAILFELIGEELRTVLLADQVIDLQHKIVLNYFFSHISSNLNMTISKMIKMKVLETVQMHYTTLGICSSHQPSQQHSFNERILAGFLMFGCVVVLHFMYIFRVANGFMDHMVCICSLSGNSITFICFVTVVLKSNLLFKIIDNLEMLIDASELFSSHFLK